MFDARNSACRDEEEAAFDELENRVRVAARRCRDSGCNSNGHARTHLAMNALQAAVSDALCTRTRGFVHGDQCKAFYARAVAVRKRMAWPANGSPRSLACGLTILFFSPG